MHRTVKFAAIAIALAGASAIGAASAQEVTFDLGNVVVGYSDGYMGRDHQFHRWEHRADAQAYRAAHTNEYRAYRHDDPRHRDNH